MENNRENPKTENRIRDLLKKIYHFRMKVDKQGKPIINVSAAFGLVCLIFAPKLTALSIIVSLVLGYQYKFESEDMDDTEIEARIRKAADNVKNGAATAVRSIQEEIGRTRTQKAASPAAAEAAKTAEAPAEASADSAKPAGPTNEELLRELQSRAEEMKGSAFSASAGAVPFLQVSEDTAGTPEPEAPAARGSAE